MVVLQHLDHIFLGRFWDQSETVLKRVLQQPIAIVWRDVLEERQETGPVRWGDSSSYIDINSEGLKMFCSYPSEAITFYFFCPGSCRRFHFFVGGVVMFFRSHFWMCISEG